MKKISFTSDKLTDIRNYVNGAAFSLDVMNLYNKLLVYSLLDLLNRFNARSFQLHTKQKRNTSFTFSPKDVCTLQILFLTVEPPPNLQDIKFTITTGL